MYNTKSVLDDFFGVEIEDKKTDFEKAISTEELDKQIEEFLNIKIDTE